MRGVEDRPLCFGVERAVRGAGLVQTLAEPVVLLADAARGHLHVDGALLGRAQPGPGVQPDGVGAGGRDECEADHDHDDDLPVELLSGHVLDGDAPEARAHGRGLLSFFVLQVPSGFNV